MINNSEGLRKALLAKREELVRDITQLEGEARESGTDVEDPIDHVESTEAKAGTFALSSMRRDVLNRIDRALDRLGNGTYGVCIDCGRDIEPARLEAVPWTEYCLEHQQVHDRDSASETLIDAAP